LKYLDEIDYPISPNEIQSTTLKLLARCYLTIGDWQIQLQDEWTEEMVPEVLKAYLVATQCDNSWYRAWHQWAFANFEGILIPFLFHSIELL
jgi:FKBP12-rapamycin complex-associated protein